MFNVQLDKCVNYCGIKVGEEEPRPAEINHDYTEWQGRFVVYSYFNLLVSHLALSSMSSVVTWNLEHEDVK